MRTVRLVARCRVGKRVAAVEPIAIAGARFDSGRAGREVAPVFTLEGNDPTGGTVLAERDELD